MKLIQKIALTEKEFDILEKAHSIADDAIYLGEDCEALQEILYYFQHIANNIEKVLDSIDLTICEDDEEEEEEKTIEVIEENEF